jgi:hypothetical protein
MPAAVAYRRLCMQTAWAPAAICTEPTMAPAVKTKVLTLLWLHLLAANRYPHTLFTVVHNTSTAAAPAIAGCYS